MIKQSEITIIFQGPYYKQFTLKAINLTKTKLPNAFFIFSTWYGENILEVPDFVKTIQSEDPGSDLISENPAVGESTKRQRDSVINCMKFVKTKFVIKIRSDAAILNVDWLELPNKFKVYDKKFKFFNSRIIVPRLFFVNPNKIPLPLHPGDWFFFGEKTDIECLFSYKSMNKEDLYWFKKRKRIKHTYNWLSRFRSEQHILISTLKKFIKISINHQFDLDRDKLILSEKIVANNFIILDPTQLNIECFKNKNFVKDDFNKGYFSTNYFFYEWLQLYQKFCLMKDKKIEMPNNVKVSSIAWYKQNKIYAIKLVYNFFINRLKIYLNLYKQNKKFTYFSNIRTR